MHFQSCFSSAVTSFIGVHVSDRFLTLNPRASLFEITWIRYNGYGLVSRIVLVLRVNPFFYQQYLLWVRSTLMFMCQRLMFLFEVGVTTQLYFHLNRNNVVPKVATLVLFMQNGLNIEWDFS